jgi:hypothetical protein
MSFTPYTYLLKWSSTGMKYYGVRYAKNCTPADLWNPYKTSSKYVKEYVELHGNPDIIEIRKVFDSADKARLWEHKVLKNLSAASRSDYLNRTDNHSISPEDCGKAAKLAAPKRRGRTKFNHPGVARMAAKKAGRTKETHQYIADHALKLSGRTKENYEYLQRKSIKTAEQFAGSWEIIDSFGSVEQVTNLSNWCREKGIKRGSVRHGISRYGYRFINTASKEIQECHR